MVDALVALLQCQLCNLVQLNASFIKNVLVEKIYALNSPLLMMFLPDPISQCIDKLMQHPFKENARVKIVKQEPTSIRKVVAQEPVLQPNTLKIEEHLEAKIIEDATTMLKGLATFMITMTSQLKVPQSLEVSIKWYATWFLNETP